MITVLSTNKPARIAATATAHVLVDNLAGPYFYTYDEIVDAGLKALRESRSSLWGFGIEGMSRPEHLLGPGNYIVYAHRD
jgi:hypothetical protein